MPGERVMGGGGTPLNGLYGGGPPRNMSYLCQVESIQKGIDFMN